MSAERAARERVPTERCSERAASQWLSMIRRWDRLRTPTQPIPPMIPETMNLEALLEKTTDAGLLRDMSAHPQSCRLRVSSPALGPDISMGISRGDRIMLAGIAPTSTVHL